MSLRSSRKGEERNGDPHHKATRREWRKTPTFKKHVVLKSSENSGKATKIATKFVFSSVIRKNPQKFLCVRTDNITASDRPNETCRTIQVGPSVSASSDLSFPCGANHV